MPPWAARLSRPWLSRSGKGSSTWMRSTRISSLGSHPTPWPQPRGASPAIVKGSAPPRPTRPLAAGVQGVPPERNPRRTQTQNHPSRDGSTWIPPDACPPPLRGGRTASSSLRTPNPATSTWSRSWAVPQPPSPGPFAGAISGSRTMGSGPAASASTMRSQGTSAGRSVMRARA